MAGANAKESKSWQTLEESLEAYRPRYRGTIPGTVVTFGRGPVKEASVFIPTRAKADPKHWVPESKLKRGGFRRTCIKQGTVTWLWSGESWSLHETT